MSAIIEQEAPPMAPQRQARDAQAEAIAQRLAQFKDTMALIHSLPDHRAAAGLGPLPDSAIAEAYAEREGVSP